ncbi:MAG: DNA polymerase III subunit gamma/tau [Ferruginibacter sp.]
MEKFVVSARKYRPQNFSTVVGQEHITTTLKNAILHNHLAHAFLFCGPRGVGKTTCARILAKTINCENRTEEGEACNTCNSCISFDNGNSFNIHELDAASNNSVDDIRNLVDQVRFAPQAGEYKVYIVDEVHMLSASAFNAFLKTLEEPPPYAIFILATTEKHKILPTILSRCQIFDFKRITITDTVDHLREICDKEKLKAEKAALHLIAQKSEGCLRDSLSILDKIASFTEGNITYSNTLEHLNVLDEDYYFRLLKNMQEQKLAEALILFDDINQKGFEGDMLLDGLAEFIRNLMVSKDSRAVVLLQVSDDFRPRYLEAAQDLNIGWMVAALNILSEATTGYKSTRNKKLFIELLLIKLTYLQQAVEMVEGNNKGKTLVEKKAVSFKYLSPVKMAKAAPTAGPALPADGAIVFQEKVKEKKPADKIVEPLVPPAAAPSSLKSLERIRAKISAENGLSPEAIKITDAALNDAWKSFIIKLEKGKNKPAITVFKNISRVVNHEADFTIITSSNIEQRFIEAEKTALTEHLQEVFNNRQLTYQVVVKERPIDINEAGKPVGRREQYRLLAEKYPLIAVLKEKLKLELDY